MVTPDQIRTAIAKSVRDIVEAVKITIEETPPELVADIMERGIYLAGGGALLKGLDVTLQRETKMPVHVSEDPLTAVARGTGLVLEDIDALKEVLVPTQFGKIPR
jgi:rod shape-determining protein MreB